MKQVYVNSVGSISTQKTFNGDFLEDLIEYEENVIHAVDPVYKDYIPPAAARRMAKGIKMSIVASKLALKEAELDNVDAIITGTGMGCVRDSEKFVSAIIDNDEQFLTPTPFIQSTHNTVGGQIALEIQCKGYNFTYVHASVSFESALLDALMQLQEEEAQHILVGGIDELGDHTIEIHRVINHIKKEKVKSSELLTSKTSGAVFGEGAHFFVLSNEKNDRSYAEVLDVATYNTLDKDQVSSEILSFLDLHDLKTEDIDLVVLGHNGDADFDGYYSGLTKGVFKDTQQAFYKHLSGEFHTASSFGFWLSAHILKHQHLPDVVKINQTNTTRFNHVLLYNQYRGENHSFTLLKRC